jgi:L-lactate dehydrogenase complex protein LldF
VHHPTTTFRARINEAVSDRHLHLTVLDATTEQDRKRREAWAELRDADALRELARQIKDHTLDRLDEYLARLIRSFDRLGVKVHLASTAEEATSAVVTIAREHGCRRAVKGKSMTSEELDLNTALAEAGIDVVETDLGELIVQLDDDRPSHITAPIVHKDVAACARTFERAYGIPYSEEPESLVNIAREKLRAQFRGADLGITGVNFAVAESGTIVLVMNEGNGRFCTLRPKVHVALMGIEKIVPTLADLSVLLKLLARSATGQKLSVDTHFITGPRRPDESDGPESMHVVIIDHGRSGILQGRYRDTLRCIRCGACLNICPVYRSIGGHAYGSVYPGPIGKLITPLLTGSRPARDLPRASTLCGACFEACPVKIDIPSMLVRMRADLAAPSFGARWKRRWLGLAMAALRSPRLYRLGQHAMRAVLRRRATNGWVSKGPGPLRPWTAAERDLMAPPRRSFCDLWREGRIK